jgi:hypothetical protein
MTADGIFLDTMVTCGGGEGRGGEAYFSHCTDRETT